MYAEDTLNGKRMFNVSTSKDKLEGSEQFETTTKSIKLALEFADKKNHLYVWTHREYIYKVYRPGRILHRYIQAYKTFSKIDGEWIKNNDFRSTRVL